MTVEFFNNLGGNIGMNPANGSADSEVHIPVAEHEDKTRLRKAMTGAGLREVRTRFDFEGTRVVEQS